MFNFLKDKIKSWVSKVKPSESPEQIKIKKVKKTVKTSKAKEKEKPVKKGKKQKAKISEQQKQEERKITEKIVEDIKKEEKQGFFSKLFSKKEEQEENKEEIQEEEEKSSFFDKFKSKLTEEKFSELFEELEIALLQNNVALEVVENIRSFLRQELIGKNLSDIKIEEKLKKALENVLTNPPDFIKEIKKTLVVKQPFIIIFVGINGSGKTTTIAKVANLLKKEKFSVCLAAADTFRAASIEQLEKHASNLQVPLIKKEYNSDPASVGFDAIQYAKKHYIDIVLIDTAGRMNTKESLMREMEKITRVCKPDMKIFVGESITGNDATEQAKSFNDAIDLSGIILSKADVDEKGGTAISVSYITKKPIFFIGTGQSYDNLEVFKKEKILEKLGL